MTVHDMTFFDHPEWHEPSKVWWFRAATRYSVQHAAVIICVSETTATRLGEVLSPRCVVMTVPNGVDLERFVADEPTPGADRAALDRLGVKRAVRVAPWDIGAAQRSRGSRLGIRPVGFSP